MWTTDLSDSADCKHEFGEFGRGHHPGQVPQTKVQVASGSTNSGQFCIHCNAWRGELGLEPTVGLYIEHLKQVFAEIKRVLRDDGVCFVNIGDSYGGSGNGSTNNLDADWIKSAKEIVPIKEKSKIKQGLQPKSLLQIPARFSIMMTDELGYILRNEIIWHKRNCMPSSSEDNFTVDFEPLYFYSKQSKTQHWTNDKTMQLVSKKPLGRHGIEGIDWDWGEHDECHGTGFKCEQCKRCKGNGKIKSWSCDRCEGVGYFILEEKCKKCHGTGIVKQNHWHGHDYYFERQFEPQGNNTHSKGSKLSPPKENRGTNEYKDFAKTTPLAYMPFGRNKRCVWPFGSAQDGIDVNEWLKYLQDKLPKELFIKVLQDLKNKGSLWDITTSGTNEDHYASYPEKLCETPILAGCPEFVCVKCGQPRVKVYQDTGEKIVQGGKSIKYNSSGLNLSPTSSILTKEVKEQKFTGYTDCGCSSIADLSDSSDCKLKNKSNANQYKPGIVLDPFGGRGTTGIVANKLNRDFIMIDIKEEYNKMAKKNTHNLFTVEASDTDYLKAGTNGH